jgi:hypothetical protein
MAREGNDQAAGGPRTPISWADAAILGAAVFGILTGLSLVDFQVAAGAGLVVLGYVVVKLLSTKVK